MDDADRFAARYDAAATNEERWEVVKEGVALYAKHIGVATAEFMEHCEKAEYAAALVHSLELSNSLREMSMGLQMLAILEGIRKKDS